MVHKKVGQYHRAFNSISEGPFIIKQLGYDSLRYRSSYYTSKVVSIKLGDGVVYNIHDALLCDSSKRFQKSLTGNFEEGNELSIDLVEEDSALFEHFVDFLYQADGWLPHNQDGPLDLCTLVRLYTLGERLLAKNFQNNVMRAFKMGQLQSQITREQLCELLTLACTEITARPEPKDDCMRRHIFDLAASRLQDLQDFKKFREMLDEHEGLAKTLLLRIRNDLT